MNLLQELANRTEALLSHHLTNLEVNHLLSWEDKYHISEIIQNLSQTLLTMNYILKDDKDGEGWKEDG